MNKKEKVIVSITIPLASIVCLAVGGYIGTKWGSAISESPVMIANHDRYQAIYNCGISGDIQCFEEKFRDLASFNSIYTRVLAGRDPFGLFDSKLETIRAWNEEIAYGTD